MSNRDFSDGDAFERPIVFNTTEKTSEETKAAFVKAAQEAEAKAVIKQAIKEAIEESGIKDAITDATKDAVDKVVEQTKENGKLLRSIFCTMKKGPDFVRKYIWEIVTVISVGLIGWYFSEIVDFLKDVTAFIQTTAWPVLKKAFFDLVAAAKELINGDRS